MKNFTRSAMSLLLIASLFTTFGLATPSKDQAQKGHKVRVKSKVERGRSVGNRVRQLRDTDKRVRGALEAFEKQGHKLNLDEATSITGTVTPENEAVAAFRKINYNHQQTTITGDGIELIFVTALDLFNEWQGLGIANFYDATGALTDSNVADVVITRSEYNLAEWTARFELKFESDGVGYLTHQPGMFTNFNLGTPIQQQAAPLYLLPEQFANPEVKNLYYQTYPQQILYDNLAPGAEPPRDGDILIVPARFQRGLVNPTLPIVTDVRVSGWNSFARDVGIGGMFAAGACSVGVILGGISAIGCLGVGTTLVVLNSARNNLTVYRIRR